MDQRGVTIAAPIYAPTGERPTIRDGGPLLLCDSSSVHLHEYLLLLRKRWRLIVLTTVLLGAVVAAASVAATPIYTARASLFVSLPYGNTAGELSQGSTYTQGQMQSFAELATQPVVLDPVIADLELETTTTALARSISARVAGDTVILEVSAEDPSPSLAAAIANSVVEHLNVAAQQVSPRRDDGKPTVAMTPIGQAVAPQYPSSPNTRRNVAAALLAGLILGVSAAVVLSRLDTKVRSVDDVMSHTETPLLAEVVQDGDLARGAVAMRDKPLTPTAESFRRLRTNLDFLRMGGGPLTAVVTSSMAGEGKSTASVNLAFACAHAGDRVLLIDADLRKPAVAPMLGLTGDVGLTSVLTGRARFADAVQPVSRGAVHVLTSGPIPPNPAELLGSEAMRQLLAGVASAYDVILLDAPPLLPVVDAAVLGRQVSGALVVVRLNFARKDSVRRALRSLEQGGAKVLGVVVNAVQQGPSGYYYATDAGRGGRKGAEPNRQASGRAATARPDPGGVRFRAPGTSR